MAHPAPTPLQSRLHRLRKQVVLASNGAFLLYSLLTALVEPELRRALLGLDWGELLSGDLRSHAPRFWGMAVALFGLITVLIWPRRVRELFLVYVLALLAVALIETRRMLLSELMPFHLTLWLTASVPTFFLIYGTRRGLWLSTLIFGVLVFTLLFTAWPLPGPLRGDVAADWITVFIVMVVSGLSSALLMGLIENNMMINERTIEELRRARIDVVTGVYSRAVIEEELEAAWQECAAQGRALSVVMCDIDHFKRVNDVHGHRVGDEVLHAFAQCLSLSLSRQGLRSSAKVGRWGGEEFLILLPDHTEAQARTVAEALRRAVVDYPLAGLMVTASFGVSCSLGLEERAEQATRPRQLFEEADLALYSAKRAGRNAVH